MTVLEKGIKVTILGSGTIVPSLSRSACSVLVETGNVKLLFDSGPNTMRQLLKAGTTIFDVSSIFYSHLHPDHTSELVPILFALKYPDSTRRRFPLSIIAGKGFSDFFAGLERVYGDWVRPAPGMMRIMERDITKRDEFEIDGILVASIPVDHMDISLAYRITGRSGASIVYSGDTGYCENLIDLAMNADMLICESSFPDDLEVPGHMTPSLAGKIATQAHAKMLVLTHLYPHCDQVDIAKECRRTYDGELIIAEDLMKFELVSVQE